MRLMKRLAVCALAAAMSLTVLTACGGDAPAAPSNPNAPAGSSASSGADSKPEEKPASSGSEKPASSADSSGASSKPEEKPAPSESEEKPATSQKPEDVKDGTEIALENSRSAKVMQEIYNSPKLYMKVSGKSQGQDAVQEQARDGNKGYFRATVAGKVKNERLSIVEGNQEKFYSLYASQKFATLSVFNKSTDSVGSDDLNDYTFSVVKTTYPVNGVPYYAETVTITEKDSTTPMQTETLCYDSTGKLVYIIEMDEGQPVTIKVEELSHVIPNSVNMSIPEDWQVYTYGTGADNMTIITDKTGHQLTNDEINELNKKMQQ